MILDIANYSFHIKNMNGASVHSVNVVLYILYRLYLAVTGLHLHNLSWHEDSQHNLSQLPQPNGSGAIG